MTRRSGYLVAVTLVVAVIVILSYQSIAPEADRVDRWNRHDPASTQTLDHSDWDDLLHRYIFFNRKGVNRFHYALFGAQDRMMLKGYLASLSATPISDFNREQQQAFWINLYNALTVKTVLDHYPVKSIRDISPDLFPPGPWNQKLVEIEDEALTLDDIEHLILRPTWQDPRIHYALSCAAIGCPNLQPHAFTAENTEIMFDQAAREFINHPRAASVNYGLLRVSSLYDWYQVDFGASEAGVIAHLRQYGNSKLLGSLEGRNSIDNYHYDWTLNSPDAEEHGAGRVGRKGS
jgi:hypothetical protein